MFAQGRRAAHQARSARAPQQRDVVKQADLDQPVVCTEAAGLSDEELLQKLAELCNATKEAFRTPDDADIAAARKRLLHATAQLDGVLRRAPDRENARLWRERLNVDGLLAALRLPGEIDKVILGTTNRAFGGAFVGIDDNNIDTVNFDGVNWDVFTNVRKEIHGLVALYTVQDEKWGEKFKQDCDKLPGYVKAYMANETAQNAEQLGTTLALFEALGHDAFLKEARSVVALLRGALQSKNIYMSSGGNVITAAFDRTFDESFEINDAILGTRVSGTGALTGNVSARLVPNDSRSEINILVDSHMRSETVGRNGPVTLWSETEGTILAEKTLRVDADQIRSYRATARADLHPRTTGLRINGGRIVQCIAKNQIAQKQPQAQAEARRRAERRAGDRIDAEVNSRIAELNARLTTSIREPLKNIGMEPSVWDFASSEQELLSSLTFAAPLQPTTRTPAPEMPRKSDVFLQVHQSVLNNYGDKALRGRTVKQVELEENMKKMFGEIPAFFVDKTDREPWTITFALNSPLSVEFKDGAFKITLTIARYIEGDGTGTTNYAGPEPINISVNYRIKPQDGKFVFEMVGEPKVVMQALSLGKRDQQSAKEIAICQAIATRLKNQDESRRKEKDANVIKPIQLKKDMEGHTLTLDQAVVGEHGWFSVGWKFD